MATAPQKHRPSGWEQVQKLRERAADQARRGQTHRKLYSTAGYQRFRLGFLNDHPLCQDCKIAPSEHCHHVRKLAEHPEDLCDSEHTRALCESCHNIRTGRGE